MIIIRGRRFAQAQVHTYVRTYCNGKLSDYSLLM